MKSGLLDLLEQRTSRIKRQTFEALLTRALVNRDEQLSTEGWNQAVALSALTRQCEHLSIGYTRLRGLKYRQKPERAVWRYYATKGYCGARCEGRALLLLIRAAALDVLESLNPFSSREDACSRYTEAQLTIHKDRVMDIADAVEHATAETIAHAFREIRRRSPLARDACPDLTDKVLVKLFTTIGSTRLREITEAIAENPYLYRSGWPDLTLTNGRELLWVEVKTTDKLHMRPDYHHPPHETPLARADQSHTPLLNPCCRSAA